MDAPAESSGREDSSKTPDHSKAEITPPEKINDPVHSKNGDPTPGTSNGYPQVIHPHETPQQSAYYGSYNNNPQITPESPSPNSGNGRATYNAGGSFFQPQSVGAFQNSPFTNEGMHPYAGNNTLQPPSSPTQSMGGIPPASPLFPRMTAGAIPAYLNTPRGGDTSMNPGMSPVPSGYASSNGMYIQGAYPVLSGRPSGSSSGNNNSTFNSNNGNEEFVAWNENRNAPYSISPAHGGMPFVPGIQHRPDRSSSFDDTSVPHSSLDGPQEIYGAGPGPQAWGYGPPPPDSYGNNANVTHVPLRTSGGPPVPYPGGQYRPPPNYINAGPYGGFNYPTNSPGPPIQTTGSNKGPDGANLFIFHIPNHFVNLDMYQLFSPYGRLLSVRIMVEKDSGRSRGFGFVSYDNPDAAALAIKELNGFAIGNKRLKVQHKQIRPAEQEANSGVNTVSTGGYPGGGRGRGGRGAFSGRGRPNLPPSGAAYMPSGGFYNATNDLNDNPSPPPAVSGSIASGEAKNVVVVLGNGPSNSTNVPTTETAVATSAVSRQDKHKATSDPLSKMDPLGQTLPDIGGAATAAVSHDN